MAYRLCYQCQVFWVGPGMGPMGAQLSPLPLGQAGGAQAIAFFNQQGGQNSPTFLGADVTNLTNAMAADIAAQLNVPAILARIQNFSTGAG